jgi:hypothetical protein
MTLPEIENLLEHIMNSSETPDELKVKMYKLVQHTRRTTHRFNTFYTAIVSMLLLADNQSIIWSKDGLVKIKQLAESGKTPVVDYSETETHCLLALAEPMSLSDAPPVVAEMVQAILGQANLEEA